MKRNTRGCFALEYSQIPLTGPPFEDSMKIFHIASSILVACMPLVASAHPGHLDGEPLAHSAAHALPYVLAVVALCIVAKRQIERAFHSIKTRRRTRD